VQVVQTVLGGRLPLKGTLIGISKQPWHPVNAISREKSAASDSALLHDLPPHCSIQALGRSGSRARHSASSAAGRPHSANALRDRRRSREPWWTR
jgi:hypothetical protein